MINVSELNFKYNSYKETKVLDNISFDVGKGEIACLLGPSGCGKTSTLRLIAGLETPNSGSITIAGGSVADDRTFLEPHKRGIGFLFQDFALFPHLTVQQNIGWGLINLDKKDKVKRIKELLDLIKEKIHDKIPNENIYISRERQLKCLILAKEELEKSKEDKTVDLFAEDIRLAIKNMSALFGNVDIEDILDIVFADFCIGK